MGNVLYFYRMMLQQKRDGIQKSSGDYFIEYNQFVAKVTKEINDGKLSHQKQTKKVPDHLNTVNFQAVEI